jgi:RAQPRD family integrative conjugative element protein
MRIARLPIVIALCAAASLASGQDSTEPAAPTAVRPAPIDRVDAEREALARIASELVAIEAMAREAAPSAPSMARVQFRYDWLIADLRLIERGIREHLDAPRQPRPVVPLKGDYRR